MINVGGSLQGEGMSDTLIDFLSRKRRGQFVGRGSQICALEQRLEAEEPFGLLYVHGQAGVGKSALLQEFRERCRERYLEPLLLDGAEVEASPAAFREALKQILNVEGDPFEELHSRADDSRQVLLIDSLERIRPLDTWLRERFLPRLPLNSLVVMAGREDLPLGWRRDPAWRQLIEHLPLQPLTEQEAIALLTTRGVPSESFASALHFSQGHPLALSLIADLFAQRSDVSFDPTHNPDLIAILLEQLLEEVPGPAHRAALEVAALVRTTTEALLSEMLQIPDAHGLFSWLRGLSFMTSRPGGLTPHEMAREALRSDLRWRNPDWYAELHERARVYYRERLRRTTGERQQRILLDYVYLHRDNPMVQPFFDWQTAASSVPGAYRPDDHPALLAMTAAHEGERSARLLAYWLERQAHNVLVFRDADDTPTGYVLMLSLEALQDEERRIDPAVSAALDHLDRTSPLRPGERATLFRFWMDVQEYQSVSTVQSLIFINALRHYLTTHALAFTFFPCAHPDFWAPVLEYADVHRIEAADFAYDGHTFGTFGHDWRICPPWAWLDLLAAREIEEAAEGRRPQEVKQTIVLGEEEFAEAVRELLKNYHRDDALLQNPLLRCRFLQQRTREGREAGSALDELREICELSLQTLRNGPRDAKLYRVLYHTYFKPAGTQEQISELLDLPHGTYRRHLRRGIERIHELLWSRELHTSDDALGVSEK